MTTRTLPPAAEAIKRYNDNRCPGGSCMLDDAPAACKGSCRYALAQAAVEDRPLPEVPIVVDQLDDADPLAPARGVIVGLAISAAAAVAFVLIGTGIGDLLHVLMAGAK